MKENYNKRRLGGVYEEQAARYLEEQGLVIVERNYRFRFGEIDLIAQDGEYLVFVEVKYRSSRNSGSPLAAVDAAKQHVISRVAKNYLLTCRRSVDIPCRFDVVGFDGDEITWVKNAFDYR